MRKLFLGMVALLSVVTVQSAQAQDGDSFLQGSGLYAGVYGGYGWTNTDNSNGADPSPSGVDYGVYGGYQIDSILKNAGFDLTGALEIHYGRSNADNTTGGVKMEKGREIGISFRPGLAFLKNEKYRINPYGILGYKITEYETSVAGLKSEEDYHGVALGLGTELMTEENMSVRLDYSYTWYLEEDDIDPSESNLRLGVGFSF